MACTKCRQSGRVSSTMRTTTNVPKVGSSAPVRYIVDGKRFSTLTAAQDYAAGKPGVVIRQVN